MGYKKICLNGKKDIINFVNSFSDNIMIKNLIYDLINRDGVTNFFYDEDDGSYSISLTTHNPDNMPIKLLLSFQSQRQNVPFPAFVEAIIMILCFEILRETDVRIPSSMGTAISILGGIVLGDAAVSAGLVSPIMIIVVAISAISGMLMQSIEAVNSIRWYRFLLILLSSIFGFYGIFLGSILILTNLSNTKSLDKDYLYPFAPMNLEEQRDGILKLQKKIKYRNPLLSNNKKRGS